MQILTYVRVCWSVSTYWILNGVVICDVFQTDIMNVSGINSNTAAAWSMDVCLWSVSVQYSAIRPGISSSTNLCRCDRPELGVSMERFALVSRQRQYLILLLLLYSSAAAVDDDAAAVSTTTTTWGVLNDDVCDHWAYLHTWPAISGRGRGQPAVVLHCRFTFTVGGK